MKINRSIRTKQTVKPVVKELVQSELTKLILEANIPTVLCDTMNAWKLLGNRWLSCMEAGLELSAMNKELESGDININAVRALIYLGYMVEKKGGFIDGWLVTYRLSDKGKKAVKLDEPEPTKPKTVTKPVVSVPEKGRPKPKMTELVDCAKCKGSGADKNGNLCNVCEGTGEVEVSTNLVKQIAPNARVSKELKAAPKPVVKTKVVVRRK